ncbi:transcription termination factor NusA [uncultured Eubacterium sp.]|uniref:transcription termination factor NusA n=1 Tax=uncultured Eubacterium sp. TaxID=165185 RepID=UPI0026717B40|nr:transcription termination factor NusA [uncultured Eubacterium sp.]
MNKELITALELLEKEKGISKESLFEAIESNLVVAYKNNFNKADNVVVTMDRETGDFHIYSQKKVVEEVSDPVTEISLEDARNIKAGYDLEDVVNVEIQARDFGRIAAQSAKNGILQKMREEERRSLYEEYFEKQNDIITGIVQRINGKNISINLGKVDTVLMEKEQSAGEFFRPNDRIKLYITEVKDNGRGPRIVVSRTHPGLVKRLFEQEVTEIQDGTVEIKSIAREAGSRTKIAVWSNNEDVDAVGACVGINGARVNAVVDELQDEKMDIINWSDNPAILIENALSPSKVVAVLADPDNKEALVVVPDLQLSLAIGKEGQNARLAAKLTNFKIDIKSESQAKAEGIQYVFNEEDYYDEEEFYDDEYYDGEYYDDEYYDEEYDAEYDDETEVTEEPSEIEEA